MKQQQKFGGLSETGALRSVRSQESNPKALNKSLNIYSRNKRQSFTRITGLRSKNSLPSSVTKRETYQSLESLFDLNKPFHLSVENLQFLHPPDEEKPKDSSKTSPSECQFEQPKDYAEELKAAFDKLDFSACQNNISSNDEFELLAFANLKTIKDTTSSLDIKEDNAPTMTDSHKYGQQSTHDLPCDNCPAVNDDCDDNRSMYAPHFPLPRGIGQGVTMGPCDNSESMVSELPLTDSCVIKEMATADENANRIRAEIQNLKNIICELTKKSDLTEADSNTLKNTQTAVMEKIGELNEITRKMQRTIGMTDPSTQTFAKMFNMMPFPHEAEGGRRGGGLRGKPGETSKCNEEIIESLRECCEKFAFPQVQHTEDNLPRVIVCGNTEENFPKIVVADSRPRSQGNKCPDLCAEENLSAQEKLAKENMQMESEKILLEKQLMEKDNALDSINRKICGLQAEMRLIIKENSQLHEKVACLEKYSPCPIPTPCPKAKSPCPKPKPVCPPPPSLLSSGRSEQPTSPRRCSGGGTPSQFDISSPRCWDYGSDQLCEIYGAGVSACSQRSYNSPRLAGGASRGCCSSNHQETQKSGNCPNAPSSTRGRPCPTEMDKRIADCGNNTKNIDDQLKYIENEVSALSQQMMNIVRERKTIDMQRTLFEITGGPNFHGCSDSTTQPCPPPQKDAQCSEPPAEPNPCAVQQLRDLQEQYARLQDDYKSKLCEVSRLRCDSENLRRELRECKEGRECVEIKLCDIQERYRIVECERNELLGSKEQLIEQEQALLVARQRFREAVDELEELRSMIRDQAAQLDDYRSKYLQAQQQVEEQRRQMDLMEMDNARMNENVTMEISRVKNQFQEKLAELAPLSDILKQTQLKLQESQQLRLVAEHNCEDLSRELLTTKEKIDCMQNQINEMQREIQSLQDNKAETCTLVEELERKAGEMRNENERLKNTICRVEEQLTCAQKRVDEKQHEIAQLASMLEQVREDSARQVARTKERSEAIKKSMQAEISDFEIQLAQCRAAACTAQKERDEIRQKMQGQICNLNETLQQAQGRIRSLQGHVDYLKVSYSNIFTGQEQGDVTSLTPKDLTNTGYDACDCSH